MLLGSFIQELKNIKMEVLLKNYKTNPFFKVKVDFLTSELENVGYFSENNYGLEKTRKKLKEINGM